MTTNIKNIVSMLVSEDKITLFTDQAAVLDMKIDGPYDTAKIAAFLGKELNGTNMVPLNLKDYMTYTSALSSPEGYEDEGIVTVQIIDGKEVQGIFYPQKVSVQVKHKGKDVTIPKVEHLDKHIRRATDENSPAVRNFLRRLAPVVAERRHSAEDLMDFIQRSELPLTNDGKIIGYKRVNSKHGSEGVYVDCHSGKIQQKVGSRVWMEISGVDADRNKSCSHGLHVANLGYLRGFGGDHTLIVLVDPADFIAVPHGETNKCRVSSYDIIGVMTSNSNKLVGQSGITHIEGDKSLSNLIKEAVAGNYVKPFEKVQVGVKTMLSVEPMTTEDHVDALVAEAPSEKTKESSGKSLNEDTNIDRKAEIVKEHKTITGAKDWENAPENVIVVFDEMIKGEKSKAAIAAENETSTRTIGRWSDKYDFEGYAKAAKEAETNEVKADIVESVVESKSVPPATDLPKVPEPVAENKPLTIPEQARELFKAGSMEELKTFKKTKKKSWYALGFDDSEIVKITG